ncbi:hypothetical protein, partial [Achromobacter sp. ACRQX]|uniref:hypothetical protein n=1 Tax=Achromobacter sp. ACRQX TaxID=2918181 RepID=UPI001EF3C9F7
FLSGPYKHRTALDEVVQMMGGLGFMAQSVVRSPAAQGSGFTRPPVRFPSRLPFPSARRQYPRCQGGIVSPAAGPSRDAHRPSGEIGRHKGLEQI